MKSQHQQRVEQFMRLAGQEVPSKPYIPSEKVRLLRAKLVLEEALEKIQKGLGIEVAVDGGNMGPRNGIPLHEKGLIFRINPYKNRTLKRSLMDVPIFPSLIRVLY